MKRSKMLFSSIFASFLAIAAFSGVMVAQNTQHVEKVEAAENWYYRGNGKGMNWGNGSDDYVLHNVDFDSSGVGWSFVANEEFVFTSTKTDWNKYGISGFKGTAGWAFEGSGTNNLKCNLAGTYNLSLSGGYLYVDFADDSNLYYVGSDASKAGTAWTNYTSKPIKLNGSAVNMTFGAGELFKVRMFNNWTHNFYGFSDLKDNDTFYGSFEADNDGNFKCKVQASYNIQAVTDGHNIKISIKGAVDNTIYVLDLHGNLLNSVHKAYMFNANGNNGWPGQDMATTATANIYAFSYWEKLTTLVVTQGESAGQTIDLTPQDGKCLIIDGSVDSSWHWKSNTWVSPQVAEFVSKYMKFDSVSEDDKGTEKCKTEGWYSAAKNAYEAASFASYREELCTLGYVVSRLSAWAAANGGSFGISNSVGSFSSSVSPMILISQNSSSSTLIVVVVVGVAALAVGGYFLLRKKKEN